MVNQYSYDVTPSLRRDESEARVEALRRQGGVFVEAVRITRMPMVVTDALLPGNPIIFANASFEHLSGYALPDLLGQQPHFLANPDASRETLTRFAAAIEAGHDEHIDMPLHRKDGSLLHAAVFVAPLRDDSGQVVHHFLSYLDITRQVQAEAQLREFAAGLEAKVQARTGELEAANAKLRGLLAERDTLLAEVNHRAKNSLAIAASILGVKAMRQNEGPASSVLFAAQQRLVAIAKLHDILSKTEAAQRVSLKAYFDELWTALREAMGTGREIRVVIEVPQDLSLIATTAVPIGLIFTELLMNALKYAFPDGRNGSISVRASRSGDMVELVICDDGIVRALAQQMRATFSITGQPGVCATLVFPLEGAEA